MRKATSNADILSTKGTQADAERQLDSFLAKYDPEVATFARRALAKMRRIVPGAVEMVYDNFNWLVIGFSPTERPSEAIFSLVLPPGRVTLCFLQGAGLPDPAKRLQGSGNVVRNIRLFNAGEPDGHVLDDPELESTPILLPFTSSASWPALVAVRAAMETDVHWLKALATKELAAAFGRMGLRSP